MQEIWKSVVEWETFYSISNLGRLRREADGRSTFSGRILRGRPNDDGYVCVALCRPGTTRHTKIHILVANAFIGPKPTQKHEVNHKDGIKHNNRVENLEWVTSGDNKRHAVAAGLWKPKKGTKNGRAKLTDELVRWVRKQSSRGTSNTGIELSLRQQFGVQVSRVMIGKIVRRLAWTHVA